MPKTLLLFSFLTFSIFSFAGNGAPNTWIEDPPRVSIYPNPTSNYFGLSNIEGITKLTIFNLLGKEIRSFDVEESLKYNISDLPNGMYLIKMTNSNQKIVSTQRLQKR